MCEGLSKLGPVTVGLHGALARRLSEDPRKDECSNARPERVKRLRGRLSRFLGVLRRFTRSRSLCNQPAASAFVPRSRLLAAPRKRWNSAPSPVHLSSNALEVGTPRVLSNITA